MAEPAIDLSTIETPESQPTEPQQEADVIDIEETRAQKAQDKNDETEAKQKDEKEVKNILEQLKEEEGAYPEDQATKSAKEKYRNEHLIKVKGKFEDPKIKRNPFTFHFQQLIDAYQTSKEHDELAKIRVAFEATMDECIEEGWTDVKTIMNYIIQGVAIGAIREDHISYYNKYLKRIPVLDYVLNTANFKDQKDFKKLADQYKYLEGIKKFGDYYWTVILNDPSVKQKIAESSQDDIGWNHDHVAEFAGAGNIKLAKKLTAPTDELEKPNTISQENAYTGILAILIANKKVLKKNPNEFADQISFFLMFRTLMNVDMNEIPRTAKSSLGKEMTMSQIDDEIWAMLIPLERKLFGMLKDPNMKFEDLQKYLKKKYKINVESMEAFYDGLDDIIQGIFPARKKWSLFGKKAA